MVYAIFLNYEHPEPPIKRCLSSTVVLGLVGDLFWSGGGGGGGWEGWGGQWRPGGRECLDCPISHAMHVS